MAPAGRYHAVAAACPAAADVGSAICAGLVFACGLALFALRGASDRADE